MSKRTETLKRHVLCELRATTRTLARVRFFTDVDLRACACPFIISVTSRREYSAASVRTNFLPFFSRRVSTDGEPSRSSAPTHPRTYHRYLFLAMMTANTRRMFRSFARFELQRKNKYPTLGSSSVSLPLTLTLTLTLPLPLPFPSLTFYTRGDLRDRCTESVQFANGSQGYGSERQKENSYFLFPLCTIVLCL